MAVKPRRKAPKCSDSRVDKDDGFPRAWCPSHGWWVGPKRRKDSIGGWHDPDQPGRKAAEADAAAHAADGTAKTVQSRW